MFRPADRVGRSLAGLQAAAARRQPAGGWLGTRAQREAERARERVSVCSLGISASERLLAAAAAERRASWLDNNSSDGSHLRLCLYLACRGFSGCGGGQPSSWPLGDGRRVAPINSIVIALRKTIILQRPLANVRRPVLFLARRARVCVCGRLSRTRPGGGRRRSPRQVGRRPFERRQVA